MPPLADAPSNTNPLAMQVRYSHLSADSTIDDVIAHPAFAGFGRLILPWDDRKPDGNMHLREISALLPYHRQINPTDVVTAENDTPGMARYRVVNDKGRSHQQPQFPF